METFQTSIITNIKRVYKRRLFSPAVYLAILITVWLAAPVSELVFPPCVSSAESFAELYNDKFTYISTTLTDLHFTGYTQKIFGHTNGYYYYTFHDNDCLFVLLAPKTCEEGLPDIEKITVRVRIVEGFGDYDTLMDNLSKDLKWTASGIKSRVSDYLLSEPDFNKLATLLLLGFYFLSGAYALASLITCIAYILFPVLSPTCRELGLYGNAEKLLAQAEEELATLPQLAAEDMYITEHYFIAFANYRVAVVPIHEIIWIYKHSTLHKFLWYHFRISYTLHITANKHLYLQCPKNMKSDIDGIIDYLSEANHAILVGFNEPNRLKVQKLLGVPGFVAKLTSFLNRKL